MTPVAIRPSILKTTVCFYSCVEPVEPITAGLKKKIKKECTLSYRSANGHTAIMDFGHVFFSAARSVLALARCGLHMAAGPPVVCSSTRTDQVQRHQTSAGFIVTAAVTLTTPSSHLFLCPSPFPIA